MNAMLKWLLLAGLTVGLFGCDWGASPAPTKNAYTEELLVEMPNGCSLFAYTIQRAGSQWIGTGRYILCGSGAQTANAHQCGKQCEDSTPITGDPLAIKRAHAISKLTEEERKLLDIK